MGRAVAETETVAPTQHAAIINGSITHWATQTALPHAHPVFCKWHIVNFTLLEGVVFIANSYFYQAEQKQR